MALIIDLSHHNKKVPEAELLDSLKYELDHWEETND